MICVEKKCQTYDQRHFWQRFETHDIVDGKNWQYECIGKNKLKFNSNLHVYSMCFVIYMLIHIFIWIFFVLVSIFRMMFFKRLHIAITYKIAINMLSYVEIFQRAKYSAAKSVKWRFIHSRNKTNPPKKVVHFALKRAQQIILFMSDDYSRFICNLYSISSSNSIAFTKWLTANISLLLKSMKTSRKNMKWNWIFCCLYIEILDAFYWHLNSFGIELRHTFCIWTVSGN